MTDPWDPRFNTIQLQAPEVIANHDLPGADASNPDGHMDDSWFNSVMARKARGGGASSQNNGQGIVSSIGKALLRKALGGASAVGAGEAGSAAGEVGAASAAATGAGSAGLAGSAAGETSIAAQAAAAAHAAEAAGTAGASGAGEGAVVAGATPFAPIAGALAGAALIGKGGYDFATGQKTDGPIGTGSRAQLALTTGGLSEVGRLLGLDGMFGGESTKDDEAQRWGGVGSIKGADAAYKLQHPDGDTSIYSDGPRKGQKWTFEGALEDAKKNPGLFNDALGNYQTFGNDWDSYGHDKQTAISQALIDNNLYNSDHGDTLVKDQDAAKKIRDQVLDGSYKSPAPGPSSVTLPDTSNIAKALAGTDPTTGVAKW